MECVSQPSISPKQITRQHVVRDVDMYFFLFFFFFFFFFFGHYLVRVTRRTFSGRGCVHDNNAMLAVRIRSESLQDAAKGALRGCLSASGHSRYVLVWHIEHLEASVTEKLFASPCGS